MTKKVFVLTTLLLLLTMTLTLHTYAQGDKAIRIQGQSRYETSLNTALFADKNADTLTLVTGRNFPDALSASGMKKGYVVFCDTTQQAKVILSSFKNLKEVYILGSTSTISIEVENAFKQQGIRVQRAFGVTRYETSLAFAKLSEPKSRNHVVLVTGENFPDGTAAANIVAREGEVYVILTRGQVLEPALKTYLQELRSRGPLDISIIGGEKAVSKRVEEDVRAISSSLKRYNGSNRYETARLVARDVNITKSSVVLASGLNYADALSAANLSKAYGYPLVFTTREELPKETKTFITNHQEKTESYIALGSTGAISEQVIQRVLSHSLPAKKPHGHMSPFSISLAGELFGISNDNTQARLDKYLQEFVNWGSNYTPTKNVGDGRSLYLTIHQYPYGHHLHKATSLEFKGTSGKVGTYTLSKAHGPFPKNPKASEMQLKMIKGTYGETINLQTCIDALGNYMVYEFKLNKD